MKPTLPDRQFSNELLGLAIGTLLQVPLFNAALVTISPVLIDSSPSLVAARYSAGIHFGSRMPTAPSVNFRNISPALVQSNIANTDDFYRLAMFDELAYNTDRAGNLGNLVAVETFTAEPRLKFVAIDHGYLLGGPYWTADTLRANLPTPLVPVMAVVQEVMTSRARLCTVAGEVAGLVTRFTETIEAARSDLDENTRVLVVEFLVARAPLLAGWVAGATYSNRLPLLT